MKASYPVLNGRSGWIDRGEIPLARLAKSMNPQLETQLKERKRIAQELHDTLLQGFTGIGLKLDALASGLPASLGDVKAQLLKLLEESDQYLAEARRSIWELRSPTLEKSGDLSQALAKVSERALESTGIRFTVSVEGTARKCEPVVEANLLRICGEAVANAARHAHPTQVEVSLTFRINRVQLRIRDDGCGFDATHIGSSKDAHFGLLGMKERVEALSGTLSIVGASGKGTNLLVTIPTDPNPVGNTPKPANSRITGGRTN
jgi:signal transduction histidine kinase